MGSSDEIAAWLALDDGDPLLDWRYAQEPGRGPAAVRVTFEVGA